MTGMVDLVVPKLCLVRFHESGLDPRKHNLLILNSCDHSIFLAETRHLPAMELEERYGNAMEIACAAGKHVVVTFPAR